MNLSLPCLREQTYWQSGQKKKDHFRSRQSQEQMYKDIRQEVHDLCTGKARDGGDCGCASHDTTGGKGTKLLDTRCSM